MQIFGHFVQQQLNWTDVLSSFTQDHIDGLVQDCGISSALAMEMQQSYNNALI